MFVQKRIMLEAFITLLYHGHGIHIGKNTTYHILYLRRYTKQNLSLKIVCSGPTAALPISVKHATPFQEIY